VTKKGWIVLAAVVGAGGCCLLSGVMLLALGTVDEGEGTVGGPVALVAPPGSAPEGSVVGTWGTTSLGVPPYDTATGAWGPLNAEGTTLTLKDDGSFEKVWVKTMAGGHFGTYLRGSWELEDGLLTLDVEYSKTTAGGTPASQWKYAAARTSRFGVPYLVLRDLDTGLTEQLRMDGR